jgi:hypothetical protein
VRAANFWDEVGNYLYDYNYDYYGNNNYFNGYNYYNNGYYNSYGYNSINYYDDTYDYNNYDYNYTSSCPYMSYYNYYSQVCECYEGYVWYDYQCISQSQYCQRYLGSNSRYDRWTNTCLCQNGYELEGQYCVYRGYYQRYDNDDRQNDHQRNDNNGDNRPRPTAIPPMPRNTPIQPNPGDNRPRPTAIPPMPRNTPIQPNPLNIRVPTTIPWPTITPHPIPSWLLEFNRSKITPTIMPVSQNNVCIDPNSGKKCVNINIGVNPNNGPTPTLVPAIRPSPGTTISTATPKTASSSGFIQWISSFFGKK